MKKLLTLFAGLLILSSFQGDNKATLDKDQEKAAYALINEIRSNPDKYTNEMHFNSAGVTRTKLAWNETLAKVAETKALDMANREYFAHEDPDGYGMNHFIAKAGYSLEPEWTESKSDNFFESIDFYESSDSYSTAEDIIKTLIIDKGLASAGHRKHLLGIEDWNAKLTDIGIGIADRKVGNMYKTYTSVVIARHHW